MNRNLILIISGIVIAFVMVTIVGSLAYELLKYLQMEEAKKTGIGGCYTYVNYPFGFEFELVDTCFSNLDKEKPTCDERTGWGGCGSIHSEYRDENKIQDILDHCKPEEPGVGRFAYANVYQNDTHYIDTNICKWIEFSDYKVSPLCTDEMIIHLHHYSNVFDDSQEFTFFELPGLPESINESNYEICKETARELKKSIIEEKYDRVQNNLDN